MNVKPFLTLASERLAGTPHLLWGEAESTSREEKPRAPAERRSRGHQPRGEAESTSREEKQRVSIKEYPAQDSIQPKIEGLVLINPFQVFLVLVVRTGRNSCSELRRLVLNKLYIILLDLIWYIIKVIGA